MEEEILERLANIPMKLEEEILGRLEEAAEMLTLLGDSPILGSCHGNSISTYFRNWGALANNEYTTSLGWQIAKITRLT